MPDLIPWGVREISKLKGDVDRLFEAMCEDFGITRAFCREDDVRLMEADGLWAIAWSLPGFEPEDVSVNVRGRVLAMQAVRKDAGTGGLVSLARELTLPFVPDDVQADFSAGILTVRLRRQPPRPPRTVPVVRK